MTQQRIWIAHRVLARLGIDAEMASRCLGKLIIDRKAMAELVTNIRSGDLSAADANTGLALLWETKMLERGNNLRSPRVRRRLH